MIYVFGNHVDVAHGICIYTDIYVYIHTMYTLTYTHIHIPAVCVHVCISGLHTDEMTKLQKWLDVSHSKCEGTILFIKELTSSPWAYTLRQALWDATFISLNFSRSCGWHAKPRKHSPARGGVSKFLGCGHLHLAFPGRNSTLINPHQAPCWWFLRRWSKISHECF